MTISGRKEEFYRLLVGGRIQMIGLLPQHRADDGEHADHRDEAKQRVPAPLREALTGGQLVEGRAHHPEDGDQFKSDGHRPQHQRDDARTGCLSLRLRRGCEYRSVGLSRRLRGNFRHWPEPSPVLPCIAHGNAGKKTRQMLAVFLCRKDRHAT
jgi:hypothetical protein